MNTSQRSAEIQRLEKAFWDSMVAGQPEVATRMLAEPAVMVNGHGATKFNHSAYTRMAKDDKYKLVDYTISDMDVIFPREDVAVATYQVDQLMESAGESIRSNVYDTSTWLMIDGEWRCVMHTESTAEKIQR